MIDRGIRAELEPLTGPIERVTFVVGGCIANAAKVLAARGTFFLKQAEGDPGATFEAEAAGLRALRVAAVETGLGVPEVLHTRDGDGTGAGLLLLEWIEPGSAGPDLWRQLGEGLAHLHREQAPGDGSYGFERDNFIGSLPQENGWLASWTDFFAERRLIPQMERARSSGHWQRRWDGASERLLKRLPDLLPARPHPALLHGDLWSGNQLTDVHGRPWIVDPATYVGDREADLAMTELFGGFGGAFYRAYHSVWPLDPGYEQRREIYNLYHLLNHLNHFGAVYSGGVERTLSRFGG